MRRALAAIVGVALASSPVLAPAAEPAPPADADTAHELQRGRTLRVAGGVSLGAGLGLLAIGGISWMMRSTAIRRADNRRFYVDGQRLLDRARRRHSAAVVGAGLGISVAVVGAALLITGATVSNRARRRAVLLPELAPGYAGMGATFRF